MKKQIFKKMSNVSIYYNGDSEIRLRKGVWNFEEVAINLNYVSENLAKAIKEIFSNIDENIEYSLEKVNTDCELSVDEFMNLSSMLEELHSQNYLCDETTNNIDLILKDIIGGSISKRFGFYQSNSFAPILLLCDNTIVADTIVRQGEDLSMPIKTVSDIMIDKLMSLDISNMDPLTTKENLSEIVSELDIYPSFLIVLEKPNMKLIRAFNRALKIMNKSATLVMLDGPFVTMTTVKPPETGCLECFENRVVARMEEMSIYQNFVSQSKFEQKDYTYVTPILNTFAMLGLQEMLLILATGKSKFIGRVLSIYLPLFEVQIQDLLRIPVCPACGAFACAEFEEMYTSTQNIVGKLVDKVILTRNKK